MTIDTQPKFVRVKGYKKEDLWYHPIGTTPFRTVIQVVCKTIQFAI